MRYSPLKTALCLSLFGLVPGAHAATLFFEANLAGANENPPVVTPGTGFARLTIDDAAKTMRVETTFANLIGNAAIAHIHCCAVPPTNVSPATTVPSFPGFPTGVTTGSYDQTFDMLLASSYNPSFVTAAGSEAAAFTAFLNGLKADQAYFNLHTTAFGGGEIRGQLSLVPEPATWGLMILGFGLIGGALRYRQRERAARPANA